MRTEYYLPGSNANLFNVRREDHYDPNCHGCGDITDIEMTAEEAFHLKERVLALEKALDTILQVANTTTPISRAALRGIVNTAKVA